MFSLSFGCCNVHRYVSGRHENFGSVTSPPDDRQVSGVFAARNGADSRLIHITGGTRPIGDREVLNDSEGRPRHLTMVASSTVSSRSVDVLLVHLCSSHYRGQWNERSSSLETLGLDVVLRAVNELTAELFLTVRFCQHRLLLYSAHTAGSRRPVNDPTRCATRSSF